LNLNLKIKGSDNMIYEVDFKLSKVEYETIKSYMDLTTFDNEAVIEDVIPDTVYDVEILHENKNTSRRFSLELVEFRQDEEVVYNLLLYIYAGYGWMLDVLKCDLSKLQFTDQYSDTYNINFTVVGEDNV
jgi:hypothetical protein